MNEVNQSNKQNCEESNSFVSQQNIESRHLHIGDNSKQAYRSFMPNNLSANGKCCKYKRHKIK